MVDGSTTGAGAPHASQQERMKVFKRFCVQDEANGQHIPHSLAMNALHRLGYQPSKTQLQKELSIRGALTFERFEAVCDSQEHKQVARTELIESLRVFDKEHAGRLERSVVEKLLRMGEDGLTDKELEYAMNFAQEDSFVFVPIDEEDQQDQQQQQERDDQQQGGEERLNRTRKEPITYINIESFATVLLEGKSGGSSRVDFGTSQKSAAAGEEDDEGAAVVNEGSKGADMEKGEVAARPSEEELQAQREAEEAKEREELETKKREEEEKERKRKEREEAERKQREKEEADKKEEQQQKSRSAPEEKKEEKKEGGGCCVVM